jgi:hypothetical protein
MTAYDLEKPMGTLCTKLHEKSKYNSRNNRYPKTNPPPKCIINEKYFKYPIGKYKKQLKKCSYRLEKFYKNHKFSKLPFLHAYLTNQLFPSLGTQ